jgi:hypothetical protein
MIQEIDRWDAEKWLQDNKDIWNHPMVSDRTDKNGYEVADLMVDFANYILSKQKQKTIDMKQTAVQWLEDRYRPKGYITAEEFEKAKEMEKEQKNNMPVHIHEGISNLWVYIEGGVIHVKPNDLEMVKQCQFEIDNSTSSATKCKWCGQEKWQHKTYGGNK